MVALVISNNARLNLFVFKIHMKLDPGLKRYACLAYQVTQIKRTGWECKTSHRTKLFTQISFDCIINKVNKYSKLE